MKITADGQITIPREIRERLGLLPDTEVEVEVEGDCMQVRKVQPPAAGRGWELVEHLRGRATSGLTTDEIMAMTRDDDGR